jgi:hypothetical protein
MKELAMLRCVILTMCVLWLLKVGVADAQQDDVLWENHEKAKFIEALEQAGGKVSTIGVPGHFLARRSPPSLAVVIGPEWSGPITLLDNKMLKGVVIAAKANIDDHFFKSLCDLPQLRSLVIEYDDVAPDWDVSHINRLRDLWELRIEGKAFTDEHLRLCRKLHKLERLALMDVSVTNQAATTIQEQFPSMTRLDLRNTSMRSPISEFIPDNIQVLTLQGIRLNHNDIQFLVSLPRLETVGVVGMDITEEMRATMRTSDSTSFYVDAVHIK